MPPRIAEHIPVVYEDEGQEDLGDSLSHYLSVSILFYGIRAHLAWRNEFQVLPDMNLYYHPTDKMAYVSPDVMVVRPSKSLPRNLEVYRIGVEGPAPLLAIDVLSSRSAQQGDMTVKQEIYRALGVRELILVDATSEFLPERLRIQRPSDGVDWIKSQDRDGGVTSEMGFRIVIEDDNLIRVVDTATGYTYVRPAEAERYRSAMAEEEA